MTGTSEGLVQSVQVRLVQRAKQTGVDPNLVLTHYAIERFLYRLSRSPHAERFVLKGALLLLAWLGETFRPTRDADLLGSGDLSDEALAELFAGVCRVAVEPDAMTFDAGSIRVAAIRPEDAYGGKRVTLRARLGPARLRVQLDVGIGDVVTPGPVWLDYPGLLDFTAPRLRAYPPETVVAEKLHAMVALGSKNSRMKDFFDVHALAERRPFGGRRLARAVSATFERRRTPIPNDLPLALTPAFARIAEKRTQWEAFVHKNHLQVPRGGLETVVAQLSTFLGPILHAVRDGDEIARAWPAGGPWQLEMQIRGKGRDG